ncbi:MULTISPECIES: (d)CMP kinase [Bacillaceae]|uniref:Cytidylate kinase n=1 Tax=Peribacillus huizhouensis TaxID=1501239 RepID=A0ABR6CS90_9BACI|nr:MULTISPECIES: (d)CMP kinase [Bacillaceae]MBA9027222.1 cytidylate kinase [Peribacillus huizhouensis]
MRKKISVAIDGPAAAGKSTVAKIVAEHFNYIYVDTGAMYRALTYKAFSEGINPTEEQQLFSLLTQTEIVLKPSEHGQLVFLDGENVTAQIRNNEVTGSVSEVSKHRSIREEMVRRQQQLAKGGGVVMDGRDIGTHVLPEAEVKVFLIASVEERAQRRYQENAQKGFSADIEKLKEEIALRDKLDSEREVSPLKKANDAIELDTTSMTIEQVAKKITSLIEERIR